MGKVKKFVKNTLMWKYERGTYAYDFMVIIILAFIFLVPDRCFPKPTPKRVETKTPTASQTKTQPSPPLPAVR